MNSTHSSIDPARGFRVTVVADSISNGVRLTTFACRFPRVILAEVNTHRSLSRNAASSRAIPVNVIVEQVENDPYIPGDLPDGEWMGNSPGMEAMSPLEVNTKLAAKDEFRQAAKSAVAHAKKLRDMGIAKQDANRLMEPFQWVRWVGTATDWDNYFALRTDRRADPRFRFLARSMFVAFNRSVPQQCKLHLPFITASDWDAANDAVNPGIAVDPPDWFPGWWYGRGVSPKMAFNLMAWSAARCARVSVKNFRTDDTDRKKDFETFIKLTTDIPRHSSPCEQQAFAGIAGGLGGNFRKPWSQFRKLIPLETMESFDPTTEEVGGWNVPNEVFGGTPGVDW